MDLRNTRIVSVVAAMAIAVPALGAGLASADNPTTPTYPNPTPTAPTAPAPVQATLLPDPNNHTRPDALINVVGNGTYSANPHFFFQVQKIQCYYHATKIAFTVLKVHQTVACATRLAMISGFLTPGSTVAITERALRTGRGGRILSRGPIHTKTMQVPAY